MDHLLVPDVQNIIIGLLDHITQQRLSLTNKDFKSLLLVRDPTVWEFKFSKNEELVLPYFLRKGNCTVYWGDSTADEYIVEKDDITLSHSFNKGTYKIFIFANSDDTLFSSSEFFQTCDNMKSFIRLGKGLTDLSHFFYGCLINIPLNHLDTSRVTDMSGMFCEAKLFNQPLEKWNVSNVTDMSHMFYRAFIFNQRLEKWNVSNVTDMSYMFCNASNFNQPLEKWNVSNVKDLSAMFLGASRFYYSLQKWKVNKMTDMSHMFEKTHIIPSWHRE